MLISWKKALLLGMLCLVSACTRQVGVGDDPKNRLSDYISRSFAVKGPADKTALLEFLTGEAKDRLAAWSDEQFLAAFVDSKRVFVKLLFREVKTVTPDKVSVTYELTYRAPSTSGETKVTHKKLCTMSYQGGKWMISSVQNIKELVEYQNEMSLP